MGELQQHDVVAIYLAIKGDVLRYYLLQYLVAKTHLPGKAQLQRNAVLVKLCLQGAACLLDTLPAILPAAGMNMGGHNGVSRPFFYRYAAQSQRLLQGIGTVIYARQHVGEHGGNSDNLPVRSNESAGGEILLYQTEDGETRVEVRLREETVWLSQKQLAELL